MSKFNYGALPDEYYTDPALRGKVPQQAGILPFLSFFGFAFLLLMSGITGLFQAIF